MGSPMAERLIAQGHDVYVYNRTLEKTEPLREKGAKVALTSFEALQLAEIAILMLTDADAVKSSLFRRDEVQRFTGQTIIQMSTIAPDESRQIEKMVSELGGSYLEVPVLGSVPQIKEGKLMVMAAGNRETFDSCRDILAVFGPEPVYVGETGKAAALKLALNQLIASLISSFSLSLGIIMKENIDVELFMNVLRNSALYAKTFDVKLPNMLNNDYSNVNFPARHLQKDVNLILKEAEHLGLETAVLKAVGSLISKTVDSGSGDFDYSVISNEVLKRKIV